MKKIFICDDECMTAAMLKLTLDVKYRTEVCTDPLEAVQKIKIYQPDLIFMDIMMPHKSGLEVYHDLLHSTEIRVPVIFMSACNYPPVVKATFQDGGFDYIIKPLNMKAIREKVKTIFTQLEKEEVDFERKINELTVLIECYRNKEL